MLSYKSFSGLGPWGLPPGSGARQVRQVGGKVWGGRTALGRAHGPLRREEASWTARRPVPARMSLGRLREGQLAGLSSLRASRQGQRWALGSVRSFTLSYSVTG